MSKAILVAGGAGYIGSHVCKTLAMSGYLPVTLDNLCTGREDFVRFGPLVKADVADTAVVRATVMKHGIKAVIDLAGSIEVGESVRDPLKYYGNNLAAKIAFLGTLKECGVNAFVFSSTAAVYGEPKAVPIPETHPTQPKNPYGWSKALFDRYARRAADAGHEHPRRAVHQAVGVGVLVTTNMPWPLMLRSVADVVCWVVPFCAICWIVSALTPPAL